MLNWETWVEEHIVSRVSLNDNILNMNGSYCYQMSSDEVLSSTWQSSIVANTNTPAATNFKIRALIRKNNNDGSAFLFVRANKDTKEAYILDIKDNIKLYKGTLGEPYLGSPLESTGGYAFPKNTTYHVEFAVHTGQDLKTFFQVKVGDRGQVEAWTHVFSIIVPNETLTSGYWGYGCGTYTRRHHFYFDDIKYYLEY